MDQKESNSAKVSQLEQGTFKHPEQSHHFKKALQVQ